MDSGQESPQSVNITFYYKGFSIGVTKRRDDIVIRDILNDAMKEIDWAIENNMQPSWNADTNKQVAQQTVAIAPVAAPTPTGDVCPKCLNPLVSGVTKNGKHFTKCSTNKWDFAQKKSVGCDFISWRPMTQADL